MTAIAYPKLNQMVKRNAVNGELYAILTDRSHRQQTDKK